MLGFLSSSKSKFRDQDQSFWLDRTPGNSNPNILLNQHCRNSAPDPDSTSWPGKILIFCISIWVSQLRWLIIPSLMKILRELITSEIWIIGSPWSWEKMSWTPTSMRRFQFQRDMRQNPYIIRRWLWRRGSLLIRSRITLSHKCPLSRHLKLCLIP